MYLPDLGLVIKFGELALASSGRPPLEKQYIEDVNTMLGWAYAIVDSPQGGFHGGMSKEGGKSKDIGLRVGLPNPNAQKPARHYSEIEYAITKVSAMNFRFRSSS